MGNITEPDTRHFLHKDIFTHVTSVSKDEPGDEWADTTLYKMKIGDTVVGQGYSLKLLGIVSDTPTMLEMQKGQHLTASAKIIVNHHGHEEQVMPQFILHQSGVETRDTLLEHAGLHISFLKIDPQNEEFHIQVKVRKKTMQDFIVLKAIVFPGINILWIGCILMVIGSGMAVVQRIRPQRKKDDAS